MDPILQIIHLNIFLKLVYNFLSLAYEQYSVNSYVID